MTWNQGDLGEAGPRRRRGRSSRVCAEGRLVLLKMLLSSGAARDWRRQWVLRWEVGGGMRQNADTHTKRALAWLWCCLMATGESHCFLHAALLSFIRGNTGLVDVRVGEDSKWLPSGPALWYRSVPSAGGPGNSHSIENPPVAKVSASVLAGGSWVHNLNSLSLWFLTAQSG